MYAADLSRIRTDDFGQALLDIELIPSRRRLKEHIVDVVAALHEQGIHDLEALRRSLRDKSRYVSLAPALKVDEDYLTLLAREVNSYVTKPLPLARLERSSETELERFEAAGIRSTRDLYEHAASRSGRTSLAAQIGISLERMVELLELCDLVRVTGVGPASAWAFHDIGIRGPRDYLTTDSEAIQRRYADWTEEHAGRREMLGLSDIDYCRRYAEALSDDIER